MNQEKTMLWWKILSLIAISNIAFFFFALFSASFQHSYSYNHAILCGIYTFVCAFRSFLPRIDLERYCIFDTFASSMVLGRSAATIAEISFATQIALMLYQLGGEQYPLSIPTLSYAIVCTLTCAQVFCWLGVTTKNHLWHAIEESLWALSFAAVGFALYIIDLPSQISWLGIFAPLFCLGYVLFMVLVDVPMYTKRWRQERHHATYLSIRDGFRDALYTRIPTKDWKIWKEEVAWLSGYFSLAVWSSIGIFIMMDAL